MSILKRSRRRQKNKHHSILIHAEQKMSSAGGSDCCSLCGVKFFSRFVGKFVAGNGAAFHQDCAHACRNARRLLWGLLGLMRFSAGCLQVSKHT